jgi:outer membrane protein
MNESDVLASIGQSRCVLRGLCSLVASACLFAAPVASAEPSPPTLAPLDAVDAAVKHNPELAAALSELRGARALVQGEEHRYTTMFGVEVGATRTKNPTLGPMGTMVPQVDEVALSSDLRRRFSHGGNVGLTVSGKRVSTRTYFGLPPQAFTLGPAYGASVKLDVAQPLLRGFGNAVGEANLHQARVQVEQNVATFHRVTSDALASVLRAYWELAYAQQALQIQKQALRLAEAQRDEASGRAEIGSLAPAELTSFETRVAQLQSDNSDAEVEVERRRIELERLTLLDVHAVSLEAPPERTAPPLLPMKELRTVAHARSPSLRELSASVKLAETRAAIAGDSLRPALDVNAYLQAQGLGHGEIAPALTQVGEFAALSAHVGLRYETALDSTQRRMQGAQAQAAVVAAKKRVEAAERQLDANLQRGYSEGLASVRRIELAERTVVLAERQHQAEKSLFETGSSTAIRVREAEEQVRSTRLRLLRSRVDALVSAIEIDRLSGRLGESYLGQGR